LNLTVNPPLFPDLAIDLPEERRALIALSLIPGVGPGRIRALLARFGSAAEALSANRNGLEAIPGMGPLTAQAIVAFADFQAVDDQIARAEQAGALLIEAWDARFPKLLRQIDDPPAFFWIRGELNDRDEKAIAIVGTRRATDYGRQVAFDFAHPLTGAPWKRVDGLSRCWVAASTGSIPEAMISWHGRYWNTAPWFRSIPWGRRLKPPIFHAGIGSSVD
jgi:DNA processing protein